MSTKDSVRHGCLAVYGALYAVAIVFALFSGNVMAFVFPTLLGFPWTMILVPLLLVPQIPTPIGALVLLVVPPAINAFLILRTRGIVFAPRESPPEDRVQTPGTHPDSAPHESDRGS